MCPSPHSRSVSVCLSLSSCDTGLHFAPASLCAAVLCGELNHTPPPSNLTSPPPENPSPVLTLSLFLSSPRQETPSPISPTSPLRHAILTTPGLICMLETLPPVPPERPTPLQGPLLTLDLSLSLPLVSHRCGSLPRLVHYFSPTEIDGCCRQ